LETEFEEFVALARLVGGREVEFLAAVGDGDDVCGGVKTAFESAFETASIRIGVRRVERVDEGAVGAVYGVEEGVKEALEDIVSFVDIVVGLEEDFGMSVSCFCLRRKGEESGYIPLFCGQMMG